jgi:hypothetical protein
VGSRGGTLFLAFSVELIGARSTFAVSLHPNSFVLFIEVAEHAAIFRLE